MVEREVYQGDPAFVLRSEGTAALSFRNAATFSAFFVQPDTCLVLRMEQHAESLEVDFNMLDNGEVAATDEEPNGHIVPEKQFLEFDADIKYTVDLPIPPGIFRLRLPLDARNLNEDALFLAGIKAQERFDNEVLGPLEHAE